MSISDSNSERKNLTISSLAIILFYLGGGKVSGSDIRLQVVNVTFSNPDVLIYFVWGMLVWFCYRYWVVGQGSWKKGFYGELARDDCKWIYYRYLMKKFGLGTDYSNSHYPNKHWLLISSEDDYPAISFQHIFKEDSGKQNYKIVKIESFSDWFFIALCGIFLFFRRPTLSSYFIPYVLCFWAVSLGVLKAL